jgi:chloramphenicol-sensitive protein RarD
MQEGYWYAIGAYVTWGLFPIYWRFLRQVPAVQVIGHRIIWSCVMLLGIIVITHKWQTFRKSAFNRRAIAIYAAAGGLIAINWTVYVWAVNSDFILETSLGYFMTPLVSILLGVWFWESG